MSSHSHNLPVSLNCRKLYCLWRSVGPTVCHFYVYAYEQASYGLLSYIVLTCARFVTIAELADISTAFKFLSTCTLMATSQQLYSKDVAICNCFFL